MLRLLLVVSVAALFFQTTAGYEGSDEAIPLCLCTKPVPIFWWYAPVCGQDGRTYANVCTASCRGVEVDCSGFCPCGEPKTKWHPFWCRHCPTSVKPLPSASPTSPQPSPVTPTPVKPLPSAPPTFPLPSPVAPKIPCGCPKISSPVCGADGESYENPCLAKCAGTTVACSGFCPCVAKPGISPPTKEPEPSPSPSAGCPCPKIYSPVCGVNGKTYENECEAKCAEIAIACTGPCPCSKPGISPPTKEPEPSPSTGCPCPKIYSPVCGVNGKTYENECEAKCAEIAIACEGTCPCSKPGISPVTTELKPSTTCADCPKIYSPVCGVNKKTYANECLAKCTGTGIACSDVCPCADSDIVPPAHERENVQRIHNADRVCDLNGDCFDVYQPAGPAF